jgi:uncharacterized protein YbaA (DUF1428 family)
MVKLKPGETLWFSLIVYRHKAQRNAVNQKVMQEMALRRQCEAEWPLPFDCVPE